jgi:hypothetical protein
VPQSTPPGRPPPPPPVTGIHEWLVGERVGGEPLQLRGDQLDPLLVAVPLRPFALTVERRTTRRKLADEAVALGDTGDGGIGAAGSGNER